jgi:vacuolar-type H+-ATPase subunit F/Vma7
MRKYLVGIPCLYGAEHCKDAIESVVHKKNVDVLLIDNGSEPRVKELLHRYSTKENVLVISNPVNIYVNPAWNQIISHFLKSDYEYLLIMNSDLILQKDWDKVLDYYFNEYPNIVPIPTIGNNSKMGEVNLNFDYTEVHGGTPGVLIIINRKHAELIYPIPEQLKIWYGDNWIYEGLRRLGYKTVVLNNLLSYHLWSQTVSKVSGISELIEQDKIEWESLQ